MLNLELDIKKNNNYTNSWNIFSKLLILNSIIKKENCIIIVVESEKKLDLYLKISNFLGIQIYNLNNFSNLINLIYNNTWIYITTKELFNLKIDNFNNIEHRDIFKIEKNQLISPQEITKKLNDFGYKFWEYEYKWTFKITWDILSFYDYAWNIVKISFWWDNIDNIIIDKKVTSYEKDSDLKYKINPWSNSVLDINKYYFWRNNWLDFNDLKNTFNNELIDKVNIKNNLLIIDSLDFYSSYDELTTWIKSYIIFNSLTNDKNYINLGINDLYIEKIDDLKNILEEKNIKKYIFTKSKATIKNFLELNNLFDVIIYETKLTNLKSFKAEKFLIICDDNISRIFIKRRIKRNLSKDLDLMMQIKTWDYIVHIDHGIWIFNEIITKDLSWIKKEYITLEYKNNDKLFVPITEVSRVSKYVWVENPKLTWLSTKEWEKKLQKAWEDVEIIAKDLLEIYAKRKLQKWFKFISFPDEETIFFNSFEYEYTSDQYNIIKDIYKDMETEAPMDRLVCWDVWFWKTEIAFASIYKAFINKKQSVLISPLVVLAYEHFEKAKERFSIFPITIEVLTRFEKAGAIKNTLEKLKTWKIDLIIWTHRLLSEDIIFKDLWLLIIDEEHKFWVKDKEKINKLRLKNDSEVTPLGIDILTMSATPIPRSLNMALNWIKSISMLTTPPVWRQAINTIVSSFNEKIIFEAWKKEFERKWQLFFIHNRVETIEVMKNNLLNIFPWKKIIVTHGQLPWDTLEKRIIEFKRKQYDILLSTTVIENWIDFSNVNTIFINDAQNFWISQIHQLRWRVWRSDKKWYCYLLFKKDKIKEDAAKRLKTIVDYSHLWAWFELAIKDLEIRWWWDILWIKQSGQSQEIWVNLFLEMLENKIEELKNNLPWSWFENKSIINKTNWIINQNTKSKLIKCTIDLNIWAYIDDIFFSSELDKINFYREIESLHNIDDLENIISDFKKINENTPQNTINFFNLLKLKIKASKYKIISIKKVWINYQIDFDKNIELEELKSFLKLDKEIKFNVVNINRLRSSNKNFENEKKFIQYLLQLFENKIFNKKIKLKKVK